jgi:Cys-tRNA(Pro)/Cys-tRNA(Cys) deacylase
MKEEKTNAMRMLERAKIPFDIKTYEVDLEDLSGVHVAAETGLNPDDLYKTLVLLGDKTGYFAVLVRVADELDLKKVARLSGNKSCALIPVKDLEKITGYMRGGCSPIGMKKAFPTYASDKISLSDSVYISAGRRGLQLHLKPADLIAFCSIVLGDVTKDQLPYD